MCEPIRLKMDKFVENISRQLGAKGGVVILCWDVPEADTGVKPDYSLGVFNLTPEGIQNCGCAVIHTAFEAEKDASR